MVVFIRGRDVSEAFAKRTARFFYLTVSVIDYPKHEQSGVALVVFEKLRKRASALDAHHLVGVDKPYPTAFFFNRCS